MNKPWDSWIQDATNTYGVASNVVDPALRPTSLDRERSLDDQMRKEAARFKIQNKQRNLAYAKSI